MRVGILPACWTPFSIGGTPEGEEQCVANKLVYRKLSREITTLRRMCDDLTSPPSQELLPE
jgi:hypothetical protein